MARTTTKTDDAGTPSAPDRVARADTGFSEANTQRIERYCRLAAAIPAALIAACALLAGWALYAFLDIEHEWVWVAGLTIAILLIGLFVYSQGMQRLRSYQLLLSDDGLIFSSGGVRTRIRFDQVQLMDLEASQLLGRFRLNRLNLYTAGGMVAISPVPEEIAQDIEQRIFKAQAGAGTST